MATVNEQVRIHMSGLTARELKDLSPTTYTREVINGDIDAAEKTIAKHVGKVRKEMLKKKGKSKPKPKKKGKSKKRKTHAQEEELMLDLLRESKALQQESTLKELREAFIAKYGTKYDDYRRVQSIVWRLRRKSVLNFKKDGTQSLWYVVNLPKAKK